MDGVVEEARSQALISCWDEDRIRVVVHPGGHFLPSQRPWLDAAVGFISDVLGKKVGNGTRTREKIEDMNIEDMDMPF